MIQGSPRKKKTPGKGDGVQSYGPFAKFLDNEWGKFLRPGVNKMVTGKQLKEQRYSTKLFSFFRFVSYFLLFWKGNFKLFQKFFQWATRRVLHHIVTLWGETYNKEVILTTRARSKQAHLIFWFLLIRQKTFLELGSQWSTVPSRSILTWLWANPSTHSLCVM